MSIISISGFAGSGKDMVGKMIQYYTTSCSNKNSIHYRTFEEFSLRGQGNNDYQNWYNSKWEIKKWASKLKLIASILTGISVEKFEDQEFKKTELDEIWNTYSIVRPPGTRKILRQAESFDKSLLSSNFVEVKEKMTVRNLLQRLGTDALRNNLHPDVWINALMSNYNSEYDSWIITDTRFLNEIEKLKKESAITIRVNRPGANPVNNHSSETELIDYKFNIEINNDGTIDELLEKVNSIIKVKNNIPIFDVS